MATDTQRWELTRDGRRHVLSASSAGWSRRLVWEIDDEVVVEKKSSEDRLQLAHDDLALDVRFSALGKGRRVTLFASDGAKDARALAQIGTGGVDLVPEPGSPAARHEQWMRDHPRLHTARATATGVAKVVVPLLLVYLLARFTLSIDLPDIPWPDVDVPDIPWPEVPLPDWSLPDWSLPGWVREVLDKLKYVWPIVLAVVIARAEIRRRRTQDELRQEQDTDE